MLFDDDGRSTTTSTGSTQPGTGSDDRGVCPDSGPDADVVVVGAGAAGLAAAHHLTGAGLRVTVLETAARPGGGMTTERVDDHLLDCSGELLCTHWPELRRLPALEGMELRPFAPGALLHLDGRTHRIGDLRTAARATAVHEGPRQGPPQARQEAREEARQEARHPGAGRACADSGHGVRSRPFASARALNTARTTARTLTGSALRGRGAGVGGLDLARLRGALLRFAAVSPERLRARTELPAVRALSARGLPARTIDALVHPLLAALLSDPDLGTSSRVADLALRAFVRGGCGLPAGGLAEIPERLAAALPEGTVRTEHTAVSVATNAVTTRDHTTFTCRAVVVATDPDNAARLLPGLRAPDFHPVTVLHHSAEGPLPVPVSPSLLVDAAVAENATVRHSPHGPRSPHSPLSHSWPASVVDSSRAPAGRTLITSVVLGDAAGDPADLLDKACRPQLSSLYGTSADHWSLLAAHQHERAVPSMPAPHDMRRPVRVLAGLYVCGAHRDTSTAQGALVSGRRAAVEVLRDFGLPVPVSVSYGVEEPESEPGSDGPGPGPGRGPDGPVGGVVTAA